MTPIDLAKVRELVERLNLGVVLTGDRSDDNTYVEISLGLAATMADTLAALLAEVEKVRGRLSRAADLEHKLWRAEKAATEHWAAYEKLHGIAKDKIGNAESRADALARENGRLREALQDVMDQLNSDEESDGIVCGIVHRIVARALGSAEIVKGKNDG